MSVQRRTRGRRRRYVVRWYQEGFQHSRTFDRKADAEDFDAAQRRRAQLGAHAPAAPSDERLAEWLRAWWDRDAHDWAASTRKQRASILDVWVTPYLGQVRLRDLGSARVRDWRGEIRRDGCTASQANQSMRVLSAALGHAVEAGKLPSNPCAGIRRLPHQPARANPLNPLEAERVRAALPTLRDQVLWGLMAYAGLRPEEALALRWRDVGPVLVIDRAYTHGELKGTKTAQRRTVPVIRPLAEDLARWRELCRAEPDDLVAPALGRADRDPHPDAATRFLSMGNWRSRVWAKAIKSAGVPDRVPYNGRDTYASLLIHEGRNPGAVAAALGHGDTNLLWRHYAHVFDAAAVAPNVPLGEAVEAARAAVALTNEGPVRDGADMGDRTAEALEGENPLG
jgi:integrase